MVFDGVGPGPDSLGCSGWALWPDLRRILVAPCFGMLKKQRNLEAPDSVQNPGL